MNKIFKIKILKSKYYEYWYRKFIGDTFFVTLNNKFDFSLVMDNKQNEDIFNKKDKFKKSYSYSIGIEDTDKRCRFVVKLKKLDK